MIVYDLICEKEHQFESWFKNSSAYDFLRKSRKISCPVCSSTKIKKAPMAPNISRSLKEDMAKSNYAEGKNKIKELSATVEMTEAMKKTAEALNELQATIEKNFENVGEKFPEEVRKIHYGETDARGIYGKATVDETEELMDEGIDVAVLPWVKRKIS